MFRFFFFLHWIRLFQYYFFTRNLNKLSIKYQSYPKSTKIDAFEQRMCNNTIN